MIKLDEHFAVAIPWLDIYGLTPGVASKFITSAVSQKSCFPVSAPYDL
jgi:hypothetical protein